MRAITFNIQHGAQGLDRIAELLRSLTPDVVFLQEVDRNCERSGRVDQCAQLAQALACHSLFGEAFPFDGGSYGLALLSRRPLERSRTIRLPHPSPRQDDGHGEPRIALAAESNGLTLVVTHLGLTPRERRAQADCLRRKLWFPRRLLLGGDLNEGPNDPVLRVSWSNWLFDAFHEGSGEELPTAPRDRPTTRIDGILRTAGAPVAQSAFVGPAGYSDHRPVIVDFDVP